jgi:hypothetical protein
VSFMAPPGGPTPLRSLRMSSAVDPSNVLAISQAAGNLQNSILEAAADAFIAMDGSAGDTSMQQAAADAFLAMDVAGDMPMQQAAEHKNLLENAVSAFNSQLEQFPLRTDVMSAVTAHSIGNSLTQRLRGRFNFVEWGRYCFFGIADGSMGHIWYGNIDKVLTGTGAANVAAKVLADLSLYTTIYCAVFIAFFAIMEGMNLQEIRLRVDAKLWEMVFATIGVWFPIDCAIYGIVPVRYRVLVACLALIGYSMGLSLWHSKHGVGGDQQDEEKVASSSAPSKSG